MRLIYIKHLLCAIVDHHFSGRITGTDDGDKVTMTIGELIYALRDAFELGQDVRKD